MLFFLAKRCLNQIQQKGGVKMLVRIMMIISMIISMIIMTVRLLASLRPSEKLRTSVGHAIVLMTLALLAQTLG